MSDGERVQIDKFETYVQDALQYIDIASAQHSDLPLFLFGHSMVSTTSCLKVLMLAQHMFILHSVTVCLLKKIIVSFKCFHIIMIVSFHFSIDP